MGFLDESDSRKGFSVGNTKSYIGFCFIISLSCYIYMQNFFTKLNFAARLKMWNMNTISIRMSYLTVTPVLYILYFSKRKRWWHLKLTLERNHYFCQRLIIATIAIHLFLKRLWKGKNVPCTQNCNLLFKEQLNPTNYL